MRLNKIQFKTVESVKLLIQVFSAIVFSYIFQYEQKVKTNKV